MSVVEIGRRAARTAARITEIALAALGVGYAFLADTAARERSVLGWWLLVAVAYLGIGFFVVRRRRDRPEPAGPAPAHWVAVLRRRSSFAFTVLASLTGLGASIDVLTEGNGSHAAEVRGIGVTAVFCAWLLLHVGYAKFYRGFAITHPGAGLRFPDDVTPSLVDYLYFAITLGVSFAVSDVEVIRRDMRWHVMVHSVVAFLYNAAVLAVGVGVVTSRA